MRTSPACKHQQACSGDSKGKQTSHCHRRCRIIRILVKHDSVSREGPIARAGASVPTDRAEPDASWPREGVLVVTAASLAADPSLAMATL
jgi:hypothetical protein